ncbi:MAG: transcriptional repressor LexA [Candidatus Omnitrophica bacterium]|nr:transcriptional repressor LexA [Candidatus Omnitrophota bacterium]
MPINKLTSKQKAVLKYIYDSIRYHKLPPTVREIAQHFKFKSTGTVRDYLKILVREGVIRITANKSRAIELVYENLFAIPILGRVQAGLPTLAVEEIEDYLNMDSLIFSETDTFALRIKGESMINAGIFSGDLVLVQKQNIAQTDEIVVAVIGEEATVKRLKKKGARYFLEPANPHYQDIIVDEQVNIIGKVISVIRRFH